MVDSAYRVADYDLLCALWDPLAYEYRTSYPSTNFTYTAPANKRACWIVSMRFMQCNDDPTHHNKGQFHFGGNTFDRKRILTPGSFVRGHDYSISSSGQAAMVVVCNPSLAIDVYHSNNIDTKALYFRRKRLLEAELTKYFLTIKINAGSAYNAQTTVSVPQDFTYGMIIHSHVENGGFFGMYRIDAGFHYDFQAQCTTPSATNQHQGCYSETPYIPFTNHSDETLVMQAGSPLAGSGTVIEQNNAHICYVKLPTGVAVPTVWGT